MGTGVLVPGHAGLLGGSVGGTSFPDFGGVADIFLGHGGGTSNGRSYQGTSNSKSSSRQKGLSGCWLRVQGCRLLDIGGRSKGGCDRKGREDGKNRELHC